MQMAGGRRDSLSRVVAGNEIQAAWPICFREPVEGLRRGRKEGYNLVPATSRDPGLSSILAELGTEPGDGLPIGERIKFTLHAVRKECTELLVRAGEPVADE